MVVSEPIKEKLLNNTRSLLLGHVAVGSYPSHYVQDNQMIETASPFKSKIRINTYQTPISVCIESIDNAPDNIIFKLCIIQIKITRDQPCRFWIFSSL